MNEITISEIKDTIHSLEINKASGLDNISHRMLKGCISTICKPLCISFNGSLKEGVFPETSKKAVVTPIYNKGEKSLPSNYSPVSL